MLFLSVSCRPFFLLVFNLQRYEFLHQSCKFYSIVQKNRIPQVNSEVTLLPLLCGYSMILLPLGVADALPRADCFWAFSPRVNRNRTMPLPPENMGVQKQFRYCAENARTQNQAKKQGVFAFIVVSLPFETIKTLLDNGKSKRLRIQFSVDSLQWSS